MQIFKFLVPVVLLIISYQIKAFDDVKIHAPHVESFTCSEHWDGQFKSVGDALGADCMIQEMVTDGEKSFMRMFKTDGYQNVDWFGYGKQVLAPCDCEVEVINKNSVINIPGIMTPGIAGYITFKKPDGTRVDIAHVTNIVISKGDKVKAGQVVAQVGNNGYSRNPHLHISAWKNNLPLQIQFDQKSLELQERGLLK